VQPSLFCKPCCCPLDRRLAAHDDTPQLLGPALKPKLGKPATLRFHMHVSASAAPSVALAGWQIAACGRAGSPGAVYAASGLTARSSAGEQARPGSCVDHPRVLLAPPRAPCRLTTRRHSRRPPPLQTSRASPPPPALAAGPLRACAVPRPLPRATLGLIRMALMMAPMSGCCGTPPAKSGASATRCRQQSESRQKT
jgi:hypothetical protein